MPKLIGGNKKINCRLVVFDKDGTLVDYRQVEYELAKARRESVEKILGIRDARLWEKIVGVNLKAETIDYFGPLGTASRRDEMLVAAAAFYLNGHPWEEAKKLAQETYDDADKSMKPPYGSVLLTGVSRTLERLKDHGFKLAIASTDDHKRTIKSLEALGIAKLFDAIVGPENVVNGKPSADMIFEVLRRTRCRAGEAVMVGDSMSDMQMGKNARVKACVGVLTGITERDELEKLADVVISSVAELNVV